VPVQPACSGMGPAAGGTGPVGGHPGLAHAQVLRKGSSRRSSLDCPLEPASAVVAVSVAG
jgi:hypothetical protein